MTTNFRTFLVRYRREVSAICAGIGVILLISIIRSATPTVYAAVANRPLPAGHRISTGDLTTVKIPKSLTWSSLKTEPNELAGKVTSHAITAGQPIGGSDLISSDLLSGFDSTKIAISIPISTNRIDAYLTSGNHINVYAAESGSPAVLVAANAVVLFVPTQKSGAFQMQSSNESSLILAVDASASASIAAYIGNGTFSFALLPNN